MNLTFKRSTDVIFVEQSGPQVEIEDVVDIILAPSFYWVKKQELPVKYLRDVKKLLPSIFEETLPEGKYSYTAYKSDNQFIMMAYKDKEILDLLSQRGIKSSQIGKIYFAQSEFETIEEAYISKNQGEAGNAIIVDNGIVVEVPALLAPDAKELDLKGHKLSKHSVELVRYAHLVDTNSIYKMIAVVFALIILVAVEYAMTSSKVSTLQGEQERVFQKYKLPSTMFENEALLKKLEKRFAREKKVRKVLSKVFSTNLLETEYISYIEKKKKKIFVEIELVNKDRATQIAKYLKQGGVKLEYNMKQNRMKMEVSL